MNKPEVRELARSMNLAVAAKGDSQEICFVPNGDYAAFMSAYLKETGVPEESTQGEIVTISGRPLGRHLGSESGPKGPIAVAKQLGCTAVQIFPGKYDFRYEQTGGTCRGSPFPCQRRVLRGCGGQ